MSEYTSFSYRTTPSVNLNRVARAAGVMTLLAGALSAVGRSLHSMYRDYETRLTELERSGAEAIESRLQALDKAPLLQAACLKEAEEADLIRTDSLEDRAALNARLRDGGVQQLDRLIAQGCKRLIAGQAAVVRDEFGGALREMGYTIKVPRRALRDVVVIKAAHDDGTGVSVKISPKSEQVELDLDGFESGLCLKAREVLMDKMTKRGVELKIIDKTRHDRKQGSCLTREVDALIREQDVANQSHQQASRTMACSRRSVDRVRG